MKHLVRLVARGAVLSALALLVLTSAPRSQGLDFVRATYTKHQFQIPMRDGVRLFTAVYVPKDQSQQYPILLNRTPYSIAPYGVDSYPAALGPSELFAKDLYIFVNQDVRGRMMSEGEFVNMRPHLPVKKGLKDIDESTDTWDTIDWLVKHVPNNNGRVGIYGISYPGFYSSAGMIDAHPALKAASPQAPISDWFIGDDFHHNGALFLPHAFDFFAIFGHPRPAPTTSNFGRFDPGTPDGYRFFLDLGPMPNVDAKYFKGDVAFWTEMMQHETYDAFWQARNLRPHLKNIKPAVMTVGGWFDAEDLFGALETYKWTEKQSPGAQNMLVMGPWSHGGWARSDGDGLGEVRFASKTSVFYREKIEFPFFSFHLKSKGDPALPEAYVFETGRNEWRTFGAWPPSSAVPRALYLRADGKLSYDPAAEDTPQAYDEYISDPARPVPFINGVASGMTREYMVDDQRFAAARPDVLVYETDELAEDVTIAGPITASLQVATSGTDSDWIVKLIDVYPSTYPDPAPVTGPVNPFIATYSRMGGYQQLVRGEPMRGKFRNGFEKPEPFEPNKVARVEYAMPDVLHTFRRGHRIMVQVQSTWFPLVNLNPQTFVNVNAAKPTDFRKASQRVYRSRSLGSKITVLVLQ
jgi:putative CocE/NonD family hydrolase